MSKSASPHRRAAIGSVDSWAIAHHASPPQSYGRYLSHTMHFVTRGLALLAAGLTLVGQTTAGWKREEEPDPTANATCDPLFGRIDAGSGGRKVAVVIDASGSMDWNDPYNLRLTAAKLLAEKLISPAEAASPEEADRFAVVEFTETGDLLYPLGDPDGADDAIDGIYAFGGTFIGSGINAAIDELTKDSDGAPGIIVLTDGVDSPDSYVPDTVAAIKKAGENGIRVSFGFLNLDSPTQDPQITNAILATGGTFSSIYTANDVTVFVAQTLLNGLIGGPSDDPVPLLPGLDTAGVLAQTSKNTFSYEAQSDEQFNLTVKAIDDLTLKVVITDEDGTEIASAVTNSTGEAVIEHTASEKIKLTITVTSEDGKTGLFSVQISSSFDPCTDEPDPDPVSSTSVGSFSPTPSCTTWVSIGSFTTVVTSPTPSDDITSEPPFTSTPYTTPTPSQPTPSTPTTAPSGVVTAAAPALRDTSLAFGMLLPAVVAGVFF
ncbi:hypothetical protein VTJ04DRAFT_1263 [Mycothermus thermophilus]|uniref:uncharacterized protein n=1 Tax=Humicola insolens TaxID=85995 RepID=UPI00374214A7